MQYRFMELLKGFLLNYLKRIIVRFIKSFSLILMVLNCSILFAQTDDYSKSSLKYSVGLGLAQGYNNAGGGKFLSIGFVYNLWDNRLRLTPGVTVGYLDNTGTTDLPDESFGAIDIESILSYDWLRYKSVSLMVGVGGFVNNTKGLLGTGGFDAPRTSSMFYSSWHAGGVLTGGLRINPPRSRIAIEIAPFNLYGGFDKYFTFNAKIGIEVKL